ncbi:hypothetical protein [Kitasatospora sp. NBC_01266]|uniref:hypothetical protein n=1 Tax=Kitasatospora sp. NBC_01266 TaxID=2903572 RepID=UPI002E36B944|nr:hypothetical protein [Kitasatospora sp. NBC_01266]
MSDTIAMCGKQHVFWTSWTAGASITTVRLGPRRLGWCPAGRHVSLLRRVDERDLTAQQRTQLQPN